MKVNTSVQLEIDEAFENIGRKMREHRQRMEIEKAA